MFNFRIERFALMRKYFDGSGGDLIRKGLNYIRFHSKQLKVLNENNSSKSQNNTGERYVQVLS